MLSNTSLEIDPLRTALASPSVTLFAFTDSAYADLFNNVTFKSFISPQNLPSTLSYHVISSSVDVSSNSLAPTTVLKTMLSPDLKLNNLQFGQNQALLLKRASSGSTFLQAGVETIDIVASYPASNGFVHVIGKVIIPPQNLVFTYKNALGLSSYSSFISQAGLTIEANALFSVTVLIPTLNGIFDFENRNPNLTLTPDIRAAIVETHIIAGVYYAADLAKLAPGFALQSYLQNTSLVVPKGTGTGNITLATSTDPSTTITIQTPDILIDSGVIHIVDSFLLAEIISSGNLPNPLPPITQIYPEGFDPNRTSYGRDFPLGAVLGGILGSLAFISMIAVIVIVLRRRKQVIKRQLERLQEDEAEYQAELAELAELEKMGKESGEFINYENDGLGAAYSDEALQSSIDKKRASKRMSKRVSIAVTAAVLGESTSSPIPSISVSKPNEEVEDDDDDEDDYDEEDEDDGEVQKAMDEAKRILEYRRSQWSGGDASKRRSSPAPATNQRDSIISLSADGTYSKRFSLATDKRRSLRSSMPPPPLPDITDIKERKKENVRNSWWSATGVGAGVTDPAVLEAQSRREEDRKSWWSGEAPLPPVGSEKRMSMLSMASGGGIGSKLDEKRMSRMSRAGADRAENRKSWWSAAGVGAAGSMQDFEMGVDGSIPMDRDPSSNDKRKSYVDKRKSKASALSKFSDVVVEEPAVEREVSESALAFVVGSKTTGVDE